MGWRSRETLSKGGVCVCVFVCMFCTKPSSSSLPPFHGFLWVFLVVSFLSLGNACQRWPGTKENASGFTQRRNWCLTSTPCLFWEGGPTWGPHPFHGSREAGCVGRGPEVFSKSAQVWVPKAGSLEGEEINGAGGRETPGEKRLRLAAQRLPFFIGKS